MEDNTTKHNNTSNTSDTNNDPVQISLLFVTVIISYSFYFYLLTLSLFGLSFMSLYLYVRQKILFAFCARESQSFTKVARHFSQWSSLEA